MDRFRVSRYLLPVRTILALLVACFATITHAQVLLVPLDSRPAAGQFAQVIGRMGGAEVRMPPYDALGRFTSAGRPDEILDWIEQQAALGIRSVVVSADMVAYGGLIASRVNETNLDVAKRRIERLTRLKADYPDLKIYVFSSIMRLAPTATSTTASWRMNLARLVELQDQAARQKSAELAGKVQRLTTMVPAAEIAKYKATRKRNHDLQLHLLQLVKSGGIDYLILGQDDAKEFGPHIGERNTLQAVTAKSGLEAKVFFCEGIDQHSNVLVSRAVLKQNGWIPRVKVVYSDPASADTIAYYESRPIRKSLEAHIFASGARPVNATGESDYTLYVNTPNPRPGSFKVFTQLLAQEIDKRAPVAVADINLGASGVPDQELFNVVTKQDRPEKLLAYAGWNTAGNTLGTAIPAASMAQLARRLYPESLDLELARVEFLLHRFVNDFAYHRYTRPAAYQLIDELPGATREEVHGLNHNAVNTFVQRDLTRFIGEYFRDMFFGARLRNGATTSVVSGIEDVKVWLPWPRAYEVRLEFQLRATR